MDLFDFEWDWLAMTTALAAIVLVALLATLLFPRRSHDERLTTEEEQARARLLGHMDRMDHEAHQVPRRPGKRDKNPSSRLEREWRHPDYRE